jgi:hypothetical protein
MRRTASRVLTRYLKATGQSPIAMEFPNPEALRDYMKEHPAANPAHHTVVKQQKAPAKPEEEKKPVEKSDSAPSTEGGEAPPAKATKFFSAKEMNLSEDVTQKTKDPDELFGEAKKAHEEQLDLLNRGKGLDKAIGANVVRADQDGKIDYDKPGPVVVIGPMKTQKRSKQKVDGDFGGDWSRLGDIVRASVAVDSMDQLDEVMSQLRKSGLKVARKPKDRFAKPTEAGYRDIMMNIEYPNGHVGELQLHLKPILKAKEKGHKDYEIVRNIEAKAKEEGRTTMTPEERKSLDDANGRMRTLYDAALEEATKGKSKGKEASISSLLVARFQRVATATKYYDYDGLPAEWQGSKFPTVLTLGGKDRVIYELEKFFHSATPLTEGEYKALRSKQEKSKKH